MKFKNCTTCTRDASDRDNESVCDKNFSRWTDKVVKGVASKEKVINDIGGSRKSGTSGVSVSQNIHKGILFPILNNLRPTEQSCTFKLLEEVGEVMELIGKKSKASGEVVGSFEAGDLIMEYMDVAQSAVTAIFVLCEKYGYELKVVTETHEEKLREKGYLKMKYQECATCKCNTCEDDYCKNESCNEGCRDNANPVIVDFSGHCPLEV